MKTLGLAMAIALLGGAVHAGTVFEIPINGGTARIQLDDNCEESMCASLSWTGNDGRQDHKERNRKERAKPSTTLDTEPSANGTPAALSPTPGNAPEPGAKAPPATSPAAAASGGPAVSERVEERPVMVSGEPDANGAPAPVLAPAAKAASKPSAIKAAASPVGEWLVEDGDARIRIQECGNNLCGVVSAAKNAQDTDRKNPNPELRHRPILGMPVLLDMKPAKGNHWEGQIYNAKDGQTYTANISLNDPQRLRVEGCVFGFLCGGQNWTRVN
ncbi:DUF2147 domain-containing protein [Methylocapsa sp. D3K7]|uniref:DUF2147 domain-containing protein n=1 Tax=Methylocapsa sp. D3K7 TaxID=3041435 RepID=UPI00244E61E8|nr:DUF2147 domain-containing protein [Methylocapsa sp. D3K7]WGJ13027.1 DUF2147 domain-containing protein [Methylocapsa sp. D3K7]